MSEVCVKVAVRVRPLLPKEVLHKHKECVRLVPGSSRVVLDLDRVFSFDYAFGQNASQEEVYESCVQPLVRSLVAGYNATVFCYGQTGSGKTYTLGGENLDDKGGITEYVAQDVFLFLGEKVRNGDGVEAKLRVSYLELYMEELRDLLELHTIHKELHIRDDDKGNTVVMGAKEMVVASAEELLSVVEMGNALRHTGTTGMNEHSSRSHAILMLQLIQRCPSNSLKLISSSKLCLVDLAGSERAGKTGNTGMRLKESAHINTGLLALGNVIRALSDPGRNRGRNRCNSAYIPYRDAKITRLLRDSLGGTAHTLMVACVSPSDHSLTETLSVLQFASNTRHIYNHPTDKSTPIDNKSCLTNWDSSETQHGELEYQVQTLRELLKEKEREVAIERERTGRKHEEEHNFKQPSHMMMSDPEQKVKQSELSQYYILAQEASVLLADVSGSISSNSFRQRWQDWQERLAAVDHSHQAETNCSEDDGDQHDHATVLTLKEELSKFKEAQALKQQLLEQKDAELRHIQNDMETILQEKKTHLQALQEERDRNRIMTEKLVDQEIIIGHLSSHPLTVGDGTPEAAVEAETSGNAGKRPHSVPLIRHSCRHGPTRRIRTSPPTCSMDRMMAAFKVRSNLLLAESNEKNKVYCPFIEQQTEIKDRDQENEVQEDAFVGKMELRHSLNRTWTSQQNTDKNTGTSNGSHSVQQSQKATDCKEPGTKRIHVVQSPMKKRTGACAIQRMIRDLSVNICMKEELIKEIDKTGRILYDIHKCKLFFLSELTEKKTQAMVRYGRYSTNSREAGVLERLSMQSQQVQAEVFRSLQHMRGQRAQLQTSLKQQRENSNDNQQLYKTEQLHEDTWLEDEEERVLQRRAELQVLEEELKRREEVLLHREAYLQQKNNLETKKLRSSQALSRDLLRSSMQLDSLEEQLRRSSTRRQSEGVTIKELQEERDMLQKRRDILDAQLKDNRLLTAEEENLILQLEEAIESLDAVLEFKNRSIRDRQKKLSITDSSPCQSQNAESTHVIRKLKELSAPDASKLLVKYFNKVICLREVENQLSLHCEELELQVGEQEVMLREMEMAMQRLTLDADRRLTEQHREHQNNIRLLLQKIKEDVSEEAQQAIQDRLHHLERELFFYKSSSRQLKKKLKEYLHDTPHIADQPSNSLKTIQTHDVQICTSLNKPKIHSEEAQTGNSIAKTYTNIQAEPTEKMTHSDSRMKRHSQQVSCHSLSSDLQTCKTYAPESPQTHTQSPREGAGERLQMTPVRLCLRQLKQIPPPDLQVSGVATRRRQSVMDTSTESILVDSIEVQRKRNQ
ncbi:kinesin-like protein KIF27 [Antennarius striatus]|uniref:kinesin-like protein KIF27 n=1 Tax=Antennarius striatus TaxID=241820 RepID=UPI0035B2B55B